MLICRLHVLICRLRIFFGEVSAQTFCPCFSWLAFLLLSVKGSLHILENNQLSDTCFANIFSQSVVSFHSLNSAFCGTEALSPEGREELCASGELASPGEAEAQEDGEVVPF